MTDKTPSFKHATLDDWQKAAQKSAPGGDVAALNWLTPDGITVKPAKIGRASCRERV